MTNEALLEQDAQHVWHPFTPLVGAPAPILISHGEGVYLYTPDGRRIIDAVSSWWVNIHGHGHPYLAEAIGRQARTLEHVIFAGFTHEPAITLSRNLLSILPANQSRVFFSDNGSTAVEVGLKMAIQYWHNRGIDKKKIIALDGAYHGDTFGAMAVGERGMFTAPFFPYLFDVAFIDFPTGQNDAQVIEAFRLAVSDGDVAAFIYEPLVQGAAGMRMYSPETLNALMDVAREHDVLCIADEVFTGFGRTGPWFASLDLHTPPDIMAVSKGITGGALPLGVTACSARIADVYHTDDFTRTFFHGHSYTANPIACAAANASFDLLTDPTCRANIQRIAQQHAGFCERLKGHHRIKDIRTRGTILAIEVLQEEGTSYANNLRKRIYPYFLERNILLRPLGNIIYILPPYVMDTPTLQDIYKAIEEFIDTL